MYARFNELLIEAVRAGTPVTEEFIATLDSEATEYAIRNALERPNPEFAYLPIFPGLEHRDYREAEPLVLRLADDHLYEYAHELFQQGNSIRRIAGTLGVHPKTAKRWLDSKRDNLSNPPDFGFRFSRPRRTRK
jgi:hypothetical protein